LIIALRFGEEVLHLSTIPEVWPVTSAAQNINGNRFCSICRCEILLLQLEIKNLQQLRICKVFKAESVLNSKPTGQAWIDVLDKAT